jgi:predicted metal-dependent peptidase
MDPLTHADQTQSRREPRALNIEANTVIVYFQAEIVVRTSESNLDALRAAVLHCVMHPFLQHPQEGQRDQAVQLLPEMITGTIDRDT